MRRHPKGPSRDPFHFWIAPTPVPVMAGVVAAMGGKGVSRYYFCAFFFGGLGAARAVANGAEAPESLRNGPKRAKNRPQNRDFDRGMTSRTTSSFARKRCAATLSRKTDLKFSIGYASGGRHEPPPDAAVGAAVSTFSARPELC